MAESEATGLSPGEPRGVRGLTPFQVEMVSVLEAAINKGAWRPTTARITVVDLRAILRSNAVNNARQYASAKRLLRAFGHLVDSSEALAEVLSVVRKAAESYYARSKRRRSTTSSYDDASWRRLAAEVLARVGSRRPNEAVALYVLLRTGLRVGDLLRIERHALMDPAGILRPTLNLMQKGGSVRTIDTEGAKDAWLLLCRYWTEPAWTNMALFVTYGSSSDPEAASAAYKRLARTFRELAERAGLPPPWRLHRIRRTVAVQALRATGDLPVVQQLLGHQSVRTTLGYLNESRASRVREVQKQLLDFLITKTER